MTIDLHNNRIYHYDENRNLKGHTAFSTSFSNFEVLENGKVLVMENYFNYDNGDKSNLYCINQDIEIEWFAEIRKENEKKGIDYYVGFTTSGNKVFANTWDCFRLEIDLENGKILSTKFTK